MNPNLFSELLDYLCLDDLVKLFGACLDNFPHKIVLQKIHEKRHGSYLQLRIEQKLAFPWPTKKVAIAKLPDINLAPLFSFCFCSGFLCVPTFFRRLAFFTNLHTLGLYWVKHKVDLKLFRNLHTIYIYGGSAISDLTGLENLYEVHIAGFESVNLEPLRNVHTVDIDLEFLRGKLDLTTLNNVHTLILSSLRRLSLLDLSYLVGVTNLIFLDYIPKNAILPNARKKEVRVIVVWDGPFSNICSKQINVGYVEYVNLFELGVQIGGMFGFIGMEIESSQNGTRDMLDEVDDRHGLYGYRDGETWDSGLDPDNSSVDEFQGTSDES